MRLQLRGLLTDRIMRGTFVIKSVLYVTLFAAAGRNTEEFTAWPLVITGSLAAFCGVMLGKRFLHKVTMKSVQTLVGILLFGVGLALVLGLI